MLAILFGGVFGLIVAVGMLVSSRAIGTQNNKVVPVAEETETSGVTSSTAGNAKTNLSITQPSNGLVTETNEITIQGVAQKESLIVIQSPANRAVFSNEEEAFSYDFPLVQGENLLQISAYVGSNTPQEIILSVYYLTNE